MNPNYQLNLVNQVNLLVKEQLITSHCQDTDRVKVSDNPLAFDLAFLNCPMSGKAGNDMQWGGLMPPAPAARSANQQPLPVMPPLPPVSGLSIFDDFPVDSPMGRDFDSMESKSDSETEAESSATSPSTHPDDILQGELLRTADTLGSKARADSFYLVYSARSKLVKIGVTLYTYEECSQKYTKLYGHLDSFHFLKIENGK